MTTDPLMPIAADPAPKKQDCPSEYSHIHPIFRRERFTSDLDYSNVFLRPSLLASRLLKTEQSYHWFEATWFGPHGPCHLPTAYDDEQKPIPIPWHYKSNFAIGSLPPAAKKAVEEQLIELSKRIAFGVHDDLHPTCLAQTRSDQQKDGEKGVSSKIWINADVYKAVRDEKPPRKRVMLDLDLAKILLHELAHAACFLFNGNRPEDFFEDSLVAGESSPMDVRFPLRKRAMVTGV